jgi:4'-phosphopantetheinyl transferase
LEIKIFSCSESADEGLLRVLPEAEVHVWYRLLDRQPSPSSPAQILSEDEHARASRYRFDQHRNEFIVTRGTLRILLGAYLQKSPQGLAFSYSPQGKPSLSNEETDLRFNVSHTAGLAALAFVRGREIGVDVEKQRPECEALKLAERFFSPSERQFISGFSGPALHQAFFRCWTRKEAFIKAKGGGLSIPLDQFDVSIAEDQPAALIGTRPDATEASRWMLHDLPAQQGYAAALAVSVPAAEQGLSGERSEISDLAESHFVKS